MHGCYMHDSSKCAVIFFSHTTHVVPFQCTQTCIKSLRDACFSLSYLTPSTDLNLKNTVQFINSVARATLCGVSDTDGHTLLCVRVELPDSPEAQAGEVGLGQVSAGVVVTLHDVEGCGTCVASHLPHWNCVCNNIMDKTTRLEVFLFQYASL